MRNPLIKYILSLGLLLLSGHSQLFALRHGHCISMAAVSLSGGSTNSALAQNTHDSIITPSSSGMEKENGGIGDAKIEAEEDEVNSSKRFLEVDSDYVALLFDAGTSGYFLYYVEKCFPVGDNFSRVSSCGLHLVFQIFRI